MNVRPISLSEANAFVISFHRHNGKVVGHRFSIGIEHDGELVGVAIVGRPVARMADNGTTAEITRLCVNEKAPKGSCSKLYRAAARAWMAMGGLKVITYTLRTETGASLRGAGFRVVADVGTVKTGWSRESRKREWQPIFGQQKLRWELGTATEGRGEG